MVEDFERAKAALDDFMGYVVEELDVPRGWTLSDLDAGFVPPPTTEQKGVPNPYKRPAQATTEAKPFA